MTATTVKVPNTPIFPTSGWQIAEFKPPVERANRIDMSVQRFHLQGQHDQQDHGRRGGARASAAPTVKVDGDVNTAIEQARRNLPKNESPRNFHEAEDQILKETLGDDEFRDAFKAYRGGTSYQINTYLATGEIIPLAPRRRLSNWIMEDAEGNLLPVDFRALDNDPTLIHREMRPEEVEPFHQAQEAAHQARAAAALPGRVDTLRGAFSRYGQTPPDYVFRGQATSGNGWPEYQMSPGDVFEAPGILSTSQMPYVAENFARESIAGGADNRRVVMGIKTNGTRSLPIPNESSWTDDDTPEYEWALPPGTRYRVVGVTDFVGDDGVTVRSIEAEVVQ